MGIGDWMTYSFLKLIINNVKYIIIFFYLGYFFEYIFFFLSSFNFSEILFLFLMRSHIFGSEASSSERVRLDGRKIGALIKNENKSTENLKEDKKKKIYSKIYSK